MKFAGKYFGNFFSFAVVCLWGKYQFFVFLGFSFAIPGKQWYYNTHAWTAGMYPSSACSFLRQGKSMFRIYPRPSHKIQLAFLPLLALAATASASAAPLAAPHLPVPTESFLNYHAASVYELSDEVTVDPAVRARLAKHFHVTQAQMATYVHRNLVLRHLKKAGTYRVACVRKDGSEYWVESHLPAGTPIFVSRATGKPILKLACGNPMVSALPPTVFPNKPLAAPKLAAVPVTMADAALNTPVLTAVDGTQALLDTPADLSAPPIVRVSPSIQLLGGSPGFGSIFPALLGAGAAVAVFGHGNGSSNGSNTPDIPIIPAVPEASTVTSFGLLLVGGSLLFILRRKTTAQDS